MSFPIKKYSLCALAMLSVLAAACESTAVEVRPNLLVILLDDLGYADVGFNGCADIATPNIDKIARQGVRCTNGYVTYSVCGPSRAALITGRYQDRFGCCRNPTVDPTVENNGVPVSERNIAELLKPAGYTSMTVGKWHLGTHPELRPLERGFDGFFGFLSGGHNYYSEQLTLQDLSEVRHQWDWYRTKLLHNTKRIDTNGYLTDLLSDAGVDFVDRNFERPFFLYMSYNAPHTPLQATKEYLDRCSHIQDERRRKYAAMITAVDDGVGRLLDKLAEHELDERTIVFFLSDNGGATNNTANNEPLRGHKGDPFEGGVRVPFAVRWAGTLPAGVDYDKPVSALDIAATICGQADVSVPPDKPLDGVDLTPFLTGVNTSAPHQELLWRWYDKDRFAARIGGQKLILMNSKRDQRDYDSSMLFDLGEDVTEAVNVIGDHKSLAAKARSRLEQWNSELTGPLAPGLGSWKP
ncbi:MAG: sulfatase-like hydrolase/transferase [Planctomycetota bacterium]